MPNQLTNPVYHYHDTRGRWRGAEAGWRPRPSAHRGARQPGGRPLRGWVDHALLVAAVMSLAALLVLALVTMPALAVAVLPPVVLICRRSAQLARLGRAATTDVATGLLNSHGWLLRAGIVLARAADHRAGCAAVLMIDLDHFKSINDQYGHLAGDAVLATVAGEVTRSVRDGDAVGRFGGDEFVVVLCDVTAVELARVAERVRAAVAASRVDLGGGVTVTGLSVSIGAASCPNRGQSAVQELLAAADAALYAAKRSGRNIVCLSPADGDDVVSASSSLAEIGEPGQPHW